MATTTAFKLYSATGLPSGGAIDRDGVYLLRTATGMKLHVVDLNGDFVELETDWSRVRNKPATYAPSANSSYYLQANDAPQEASNKHLLNSYFGIPTQWQYDMGMTGLFDRNQLCNAALKGTVTYTFENGGELWGYPNTIFNGNGDYSNIANITAASKMTILVDMGKNIEVYGRGFWQPFIAMRGDWEGSTLPKGIKFEASTDGINWYTAEGWQTADYVGSQTISSVWMGQEANCGIYLIRYVRITFDGFHIGSVYNYLWLVQVGLRHVSHVYAPQCLQAAGDEVLGDLRFKNIQNGAGSFATLDATKVLRERTKSDVIDDLGIPSPTEINNWNTAYNWGNHVGLYVGLSGNQTIANTKTFTSSPVVPTPTDAGHAVNKSYVDDGFTRKAFFGDLYRNSVYSADTRSTNPIPSADLQNGVFFDFKACSAIGLSSSAYYAAAMTFVPYTDNTGNGNSAFRLAQSGDELSYQNFDGVWGDWRKVWTDKHFTNTNITNWNNAATNSHTHTNKGLLDTYTQTEANIADAVSKKHNALTLGTANGLSLSGQQLSLTKASSTDAGALSSTDWSTFNDKQDALSGSGVVVFTDITPSYISGVAGQLLRRNLANTDYEFFSPTYLTANQNITLSGDVTGSGATSINTVIANNAITTSKIANSAVTLAKIDNITTNTILGQNTGSTVAPQELNVEEGLELSMTAISSCWGTGTTPNGKTQIEKKSGQHGGNTVTYLDFTDLGNAYSAFVNATAVGSVYNVVERDVRIVNLDNVIMFVHLPDATQYRNRTIKLSCKAEKAQITFVDAGGSTATTEVLHYIDSPGNPVYISGIGASSTPYSGIIWCELQSVYVPTLGAYTWVTVEWGGGTDY